VHHLEDRVVRAGRQSDLQLVTESGLYSQGHLSRFGDSQAGRSQWHCPPSRRSPRRRRSNLERFRRVDIVQFCFVVDRGVSARRADAGDRYTTDAYKLNSCWCTSLSRIS
jgi:hypothetical protein